MKIQQNMDVQNSFIQNQTGVNSASKSHTNNKNRGAISGADLTGDSLIAQRQGLAKKQALGISAEGSLLYLILNRMQIRLPVKEGASSQSVDCVYDRCFRENTWNKGLP